VTAAYPVRLTGQLDADVSRWTWLVKWLLVLPHVLVLAFLWIALAVLTVVAGFAVLFTGRYPRALFDFNVGVLRWTWRVEFYAYSALGTDVYPPFSLQPDPSFPADLEVDYPEHLSRGLVLVKWWLLALPQYIVIGLLGGGLFISSGGLIGLLVLVAAILLVVRGSYPQELFDLIMGFNRWCFRVLAYSSLMRDEYPPFRLDQGAQEPVLL
jgi:hypothetical protein